MEPGVEQPGLPQQLGLSGGYRTLLVLNTHIGVSVLNQDVYGHPDNGITKLYAQLLGAKLNVQKGASSSPISTALYQADAFLSSHNPDDWSSLSSSDQSIVLGWQAEFDAYNNGMTEVGHCQ